MFTSFLKHCLQVLEYIQRTKITMNQAIMRLISNYLECNVYPFYKISLFAFYTRIKKNFKKKI